MKRESILQDGERNERRRLILRGEEALLNGQYADAEHYYLAALDHAKHASPEDAFWHKTLTNLRYLYVNFLCARPLSPDILLERTVPVWERVLGPDHYFISRWIAYVEHWRSTFSENPSQNVGQAVPQNASV